MSREGSEPEPIRRVVIPVDLSDVSRVAAEQGAYFAKLLDAQVSIVAVNDTQQFMLSTVLEQKIQVKKQQVLEEVASIAKHHGVESKTVMLEGNPAVEIVKFIQDDDLVVMASQGRKGFSKFLLGSVSEEVLKNAPCAVMIIKEKEKKWSVNDIRPDLFKPPRPAKRS
jgi:nucleotide-binding universal stress UspA family protein